MRHAFGEQDTEVTQPTYLWPDDNTAVLLITHAHMKSVIQTVVTVK